MHLILTARSTKQFHYLPISTVTWFNSHHDARNPILITGWILCFWLQFSRNVQLYLISTSLQRILKHFKNNNIKGPELKLNHEETNAQQWLPARLYIYCIYSSWKATHSDVTVCGFNELTALKWERIYLRLHTCFFFHWLVWFFPTSFPHHKYRCFNTCTTFNLTLKKGKRLFWTGSIEFNTIDLSEIIALGHQLD